MNQFNPNDHSTLNEWFVTLNHPGRPEDGKRYKIHSMRILDQHATSFYQGGIQMWGFASPSGDWQEGGTVEFDTSWGDIIEQDIK